MDTSTPGSSPQFLRKPLALAMAAGCLTLAGHQTASASTSLTSETIFNFDFSNPLASLPPPYTNMLLDFTFGGSTGSITFDFFDGLDGSGTATSLTIASQAPGFLELNRLDAGLLDGTFSVGLQSNSLTLNTFFARGCDGCNPDAETVAITLPRAGIPSTQGLPEPATLALVGIAIAGLAATRRKPRSATALH
jgi:PEP-CTERM motif